MSSMGADSGGSNTGVSMGRNRAHSKDQYTYLGEDSQTRPLEDLGYRLMDRLNQGQDQSNLMFGGAGYKGAYGGGQQQPPPAQYQPSGYGNDSGGGGNGGVAGPKDAQGGANNARMAGLGNGGLGGAQDDPSNPANGVVNGIPSMSYNYGPRYAGDTPDGSSSGYFPRNPDKINDGDNARPSPVGPYNPTTDAAPTGGLYGALGDFASGRRTPYEEAVGKGFMDQYNNPTNYNDILALDRLGNAGNTFDFMSGGGMTGLEGETRGYQQNLANGILTGNQNQTRGLYQGLATGGPSSTESQDRALMLQALSDFGPGGAYDGGASYTQSASGGGLGQGYQDALAGYEKILADPGRSAEEKAAIVGEGARTARAGFDTARAEMERRQALTGNGAGFYEALGNLANQQSNALGSNARQAQIDFGAEKARQREDALRGLSGLANTEQAAGATEAASANAAASRAAQMQQAQMQARLGALGQLSGWDESQRKNQLAGLGGMKDYDVLQNENQKFGISGMQAGDMDRSKRLQAGAQGNADLGKSYAGMGSDLFGRQTTALKGANDWANQGRDYQKFGIQGQAGLYQQQQQQNSDDLDRLFKLYSTPREKYNENYYTKGQGGLGSAGDAG